VKQPTVTGAFHPFQNAVLSFGFRDLARDILFHERLQGVSLIWGVIWGCFPVHPIANENSFDFGAVCRCEKCQPELSIV
jgi:hypothetical protein